MAQHRHNIKGFTLVELLMVVGIIAVLAAVTFAAIDPGQRLADARNAERWREVNTIAQAINRSAIDNNGTIPAAITSTPTGICRSE